MLVIPKRTLGSKGGRANSKQDSGRGYLSARQEAYCRCLVIHGMSGLQSYRSAYPSAKMSDKQATNEAHRLKKNKHVQARMRELQAQIVEVDLHDQTETQAFVLAGLKRLALNADNSAAQLGAYRLIGNLKHARMFDPPVAGVVPDNRSADTIRAALQQRVARLLPAPASANGSLSSGDDDSEADGGDEDGGEASAGVEAG